MDVFGSGANGCLLKGRDRLSENERDLAYTTVATLVRILCDKGFLEQTGQERPCKFKPRRSFKDVSGSMLTDVVDRNYVTFDDLKKD